jgi:hypothetical protein
MIPALMRSRKGRQTCDGFEKKEKEKEKENKKKGRNANGHTEYTIPPGTGRVLYCRPG